MKILHFVWGVLLTLMVGACSNEMDGLIAEENQPLLNFTAGFDGNSDSRTVLVDGHKVEWLQGDKVVLFDGESSAIYVASASGAKTTFVYESGDELAMNGTYTAVYPASALNVTDKTIQVKKSQTAVAGGFDPDAAICMAVVATGKDVASFKNVCALLKFNVCPAFAANAQGMVMTATGGVVNKGVVSIDGTATITWSEPGNEDYSIWGTFSADEDYYLLVAPQTFSTGFAATMMSATSEKIDEGRSTNKSISFEASKVYSLDEIRHIVPEQEWYYGVLAKDPNATEFVIRTPEEMMAFIEIVNSMSTSSLPFVGKTVKLGNDIDMKEYAGSIVPIAFFAGTFDGQFHAIQNMEMKVEADVIALFGSINETAVIKNVILEGGKVESAGFKSAASDDHQIAALVGLVRGGSKKEGKGALIQNCINVGCDVYTETHDQAAGIVGYAVTGSYFQIENCINAADVYNGYSNVSDGGSAGGILNWWTSNGIINSCVNIGTIHSTQAAGGIVSWTNWGSGGSIMNCYNASNVIVTPCYNGWLFWDYGAGAIVGVLDYTRLYYSSDTKYDYLDGSLNHFGGCFKEYPSSQAEPLSYSAAVSGLNETFAGFPYRFREGNVPALEKVSD